MHLTKIADYTSPIHEIQYNFQLIYELLFILIPAFYIKLGDFIQLSFLWTLLSEDQLSRPLFLCFVPGIQIFLEGKIISEFSRS